MAQVEAADSNVPRLASKVRHFKDIAVDILIYLGIISVFASATVILFVIWLLIA